MKSAHSLLINRVYVDKASPVDCLLSIVALQTQWNTVRTFVLNMISKERGGNTAAGDDGGGDATPKDKKESVGGKKLPYRYGNQKNAVPRQPKFKGKCDELKGHV